MNRIADTAEFQQRHSAGLGYIYNDFSAGKSGHDFNILHAASCKTPDLANANVPKYFAPVIYTALVWLDQHRPGVWKPCPVCQLRQQPDPASGQSPQSAADGPAAPADQADPAEFDDEAAPATQTGQRHTLNEVIHFNADADPLNADWPKVLRYGEDEVLRRWGLTREEYEQRYHGGSGQDTSTGSQLT